MSKKTRSAYKRPVPDDWVDGVDGTSWVLLCVPDSPDWHAAVWGALDQLTRGRHWEESTGSINETTRIARDILGSVAMDCNPVFENLVTAIKQLTAAQCCGTDGPIGEASEEVPDTTDWDEVGAPPAGFIDWDAANTHRCLMAHGSHARISEALEQIALYGTAGVGISVALIGLVLAPLTLTGAAIVAATASVTGMISNLSVNEFKNDFDDLLEDWVCIIRSSLNAAQAYTRLRELADNIQNPIGRGFLYQIISYNWVNFIFTADGAPPFNYVGFGQVESDRCDACAEPDCELEFVHFLGNGTGIGTGDLTPDTGVRTLTSSLSSNGFHYIEFDITSGCGCGQVAYDFTTSNSSLLAGEGAGYAVHYKQSDCTETVTVTSSGNQDPIPDGTYRGTFAQFIGDVAFTMDVNIETV